MKTITLLFALALSAFAQTPVNQVTDPPPSPSVNQYFYSGSNLQYICIAGQSQAPTYQKRSDSSLTNIAVATNVATITTASANGAYIGMQVTISGATVVPALNGTYRVVSTPSSTTYTIATSGVADATYTEATLVITTTYPLLNVARWAIQVFTYDVSNNLTGSYWANASTGYGLTCSSRASY